MRFSIFALSFLGMSTSVFAQDLPPVEELASKVKLPGYWEVEDFRIVAQAMVGTPIEPRAQIRFEIDASPQSDLFVPSGSESLGPFITIIESTPEETVRTLYGTMDLTYSTGQWNGPVNIENPVDTLGQPEDAFSVPALVLGSERQLKVAEDIRNAAASELRIALQRDRQRLMEQHVSEIEKLKATHIENLSKLRQENDFARAKIENLKAGLEQEIAAIDARLETQLFEGEARIREELAATEAKYQAELDSLEGAHEVKLRELKRSQSAELGATVTAHLEELQKLEAEHAKAVGELVAEQEREMAEVTTKLETRKDSLEAQLAAADEVLALQASLAARQTAIRVNDESIKAAERERQEQFGTSLQALLGTWTGLASCKIKGRDQTRTVSFKAEKIEGRSVVGLFTTPEIRSASAAQLHLMGNDLIMPVPLTLNVNQDYFIGTQTVSMQIQSDGWMVGQSPDGVCKEVRLSKN